MPIAINPTTRPSKFTDAPVCVKWCAAISRGLFGWTVVAEYDTQNEGFMGLPVQRAIWHMPIYLLSPGTPLE